MDIKQIYMSFLSKYDLPIKRNDARGSANKLTFALCDHYRTNTADEQVTSERTSDVRN